MSPQNEGEKSLKKTPAGAVSSERYKIDVKVYNRRVYGGRYGDVFLLEQREIFEEMMLQSECAGFHVLHDLDRQRTGSSSKLTAFAF